MLPFTKQILANLLKFLWSGQAGRWNGTRRRGRTTAERGRACRTDEEDQGHQQAWEQREGCEDVHMHGRRWRAEGEQRGHQEQPRERYAPVSHRRAVSYFTAGLQLQISAILFCLGIPSFPQFPPFLLNVWANGSRIRLVTVAKFKRILNLVGGAQYNLSFFPKMVLPLQLFQVKGKTRIVCFLENCSKYLKIVCGLSSRHSSFTKRGGAWMEVATNFVSVFQVENVVPGKTEKTVECLEHH